jgi:hypothetical protein
LAYLFTDFCASPNDTYSNQYYLNQINAAEACEFYYPGYQNRENSIIAIVEGPIYNSHSDLIGNDSNNNCDASTIVAGECLSDIPYPINANFTSHGTQVSGLAGATSNNNIGIYSIGWNNKLMSVNCADAQGYLINLWDGVKWAADHGAKVINMSWGWNAGALEEHYQILLAIKENHPDIVFVAATGNHSNSTPRYPAAYGEGFNEWEEYDPSFVIAVAAIDENNDRYTNTSFGSWVDICTYGEDIFSTASQNYTLSNITYVNETYGTGNGTSYAAPLVSAVIGHMISYKPDATPSEIYSCLINSANRDIYGTSHTYNFINTLGAGRLDAAEALKCLGGDCSNGNPVAVISSSKDLLCPNDIVTLSANEGIGFLWSTGEITQNIDVNISGSYCLTVTFAEGCTASACYNLTGASGQADLYIIENSGIAPNDGIVCIYNSFSLHATTGLSYQWSDSPLFITQDRVLNSGSSYCVTINGIDGCPDLNGSACVDISWIDINSLVDPGSDLAVCLGDEIILSTPTDGFTEYIWEKQGGSSSWSGQSVTISEAALPTDENNYYLFVTDIATGCSTFGDYSEQNKITVTVISNADELVIEPVADVCIGSQPQLLESNISGGTWTGNGVEGNSFNPYSAGAGVHAVSYTVGNGDCLLNEIINITVTIGPEILITEIPAMCENSMPYIITTDPPYETSDLYGNYQFSGYGLQTVIVNPVPLELVKVFNPAITGPGTHTITVETTEGCCTMYNEIEVTVLPIPEINAVDNLCVSSSPVILTANPAGGIWSGIGITNPSAGTFDPSVAGVGFHTITYHYSNSGATCINEIVIEVLDQVSSIIIDDVSAICGIENPASLALNALPSGGDWTGAGIINNTFYPNLAGYGSHVLTYTLAGNTNCEISNNITLNYFDYNISINSNQSVCEGNNYLTISPGGFSGFIQIRDSESDLIYNEYYSNIQGTDQIQLPYLAVGDYSIHCIVSPDGVETNCQFAIDFTVLPSPVAIITGDESVCGLYTFLTVEGDLSYQWNTGSTSNDILVSESGSYSVTVTDINGCTAQDDFSVELINEIDNITTVFENFDPCSGVFQFIINPGGNTFNANILDDNTNDHVYTSIFTSQTNTLVPVLPIHLSPGNYTLILDSDNSDCMYYHDFAIPISCPQISISRKPGTCVYPYNGSVEVTIVDGTPPFQVHLEQSESIVSPIYTFSAPGSYIIEGNDLLDGTQLFIVIVSDSDPYSPYSNAFPINAMYYQWTADNVITNNDFTESLYENLTICVGDANDQTLNITHDVTFKNCTIYCATNPYEDVLETLWAVEQENTLTLDNTTITSGCPDHLWKGVIVYGDIEHTNPYPPHYVTNFDLEPGQIIVKNNSKIMLADIGVVGFANAVVKITDSKFINCKTGTEFFVYVNHVIQYSQLPSVNPRAYIIRTEFITDNDYIVIPESHVNIYNTDKITLKGNKFINSVPNTMLSGSSRGKGVEGRNSTFSIIENQGLLNPPDFNILPQNKSVFEGLYYGVYVTNLSAGTATIRNCDFKNYDYMGVYLQNLTAPKVTSNTFDKEQFGVLTKNVGLYLKSCTGYNIENNTFNEGGYGMIVNNSGPNANKVYRNHFNNPYQGLHAYYTNSNTDGSLGVFVQCNDYHNNNGVQNFIKNGNVKKQQGYFHPQYPQNSESAANQFEITNLVTNSESAFRTSWQYSFNDYKYWCNEPGDNTDITGFTSPNVDVQPTYLRNDPASCPSKLGPIAIDYEYEIARRKSDISSLNDNMDEIVDGGSTAQVLQKVQNLRPNNFNKTCTELLNLSPYLSDTVLVTFMQTGVNGHIVAKTNVLAANSPLPPHALAELENMDLPAPHKNYLAQMQTGTNAVVLLKDEIGNIEFNKNLYINEYVSHGLNNDSIPMVKDSVVNFLMNDDYFESKCIVIPILISDARYVDAQTQINELDYLASNQNPDLHAELSEFADLQELIIQMDTTNSSESLLNVVESNLTLLESMAYNPSHRGSSVAQILLSEAGIAEFEPEIFLPMEDRTMRFSIVEDAITENFDLNDMIEVYPTPANSEIWIEYLLIDTKPVSKIDIYDVEGKLVLTQSIRNGFGLERVDVSQLSEGNYVLKMGDFSKQISIIK